MTKRITGGYDWPLKGNNIAKNTVKKMGVKTPKKPSTGSQKGK